MNESQYLSRIASLENEIDYLHSLLDAAGIPYKRQARDVEDLSPDKNILFDSDQGARIKPLSWSVGVLEERQKNPQYIYWRQDQRMV